MAAGADELPSNVVPLHSGNARRFLQDLKVHSFVAVVDAGERIVIYMKGNPTDEEAQRLLLEALAAMHK